MKHPGKLVVLSSETSKSIQAILEEELLRHEARISISHAKRGFVRARHNNSSAYAIDEAACHSLSNMIRTEKMSLEDATRFVRGENIMDSRPNKAIDPDRLRLVLNGYPHLDLLLQIAAHGIDAQWRQGPTPKRPPPKNHGSCRRYLRAVTRSIRDGQDSGQYMVVEADILEQWPELVCSPLGAVEKKDVDPMLEVRTIHDLSFPKNDSVNSAFIAESVPKLRYESVAVIARRIEDLAKRGHVGRIFMLKGDVKGAFRHLRTRANQVFRMAAFVKELGIVVIDMAAPFGWSGSPPSYALFGRAISWLMGANSPASVSNSDDQECFFPYEWVDDHVLVEPNVNNRLEHAEATLRHAMLAVLGPRSINEAKFSAWSAELVVLGLLWNTSRRTVSIPSDKIEKARGRVQAMLTSGKASKTEFYKVLGSLRHVAICLRTAKPFYQRLQSQCTSAPRFGKVCLSAGAKDDLVWFQQILKHGHLAELPLSIFGGTMAPSVELYMDASNLGLAILDPSTNKFIQVKFDEAELAMISSGPESHDEFSINVREHLCIALALWTWGSKWNSQTSGKLVNIKCWSDNTAAVNWCNKLHSRNPLSQEINRSIGLAEAYYNLRVAAGHIPGSSNWMADAASRAWTEPHLTRWTNFASCWRQTQVPPSCRKLYMNFSRLFKQDRWPRHQQKNTTAPGSSGHNGVPDSIFQGGCQKINAFTHTNLHCSRLTAGTTGGANQATETMPAPCTPSSAISRGIIGEFSVTEYPSYLVTNSQLQGSTVQKYAIRRSDIKLLRNDEFEASNIQEASTVVVRFRGSKSDQFGEGTSRRLGRSGSRWCCPVLAAYYLVEHHKSLGATEDTLLCKVNSSKNLQVDDVVKAIKDAAKGLGQDPERYGSHSLRSGGATALFNAGFDSLAVKLFGRWKSDAVERYTRIGGRLTERMAQEMVAKPAFQRNMWVPSKPHPGIGGA